MKKATIHHFFTTILASCLITANCGLAYSYASSANLQSSPNEFADDAFFHSLPPNRQAEELWVLSTQGEWAWSVARHKHLIQARAYHDTLQLCIAYRAIQAENQSNQSHPIYQSSEYSLRNSLALWSKVLGEGLYSPIDSLFGQKADFLAAHNIGISNFQTWFLSMYSYYLVGSPEFLRASVHCLPNKDPKHFTQSIQDFASAIIMADTIGSGAGQVLAQIAIGKSIAMGIRGSIWGTKMAWRGANKSWVGLQDLSRFIKESSRPVWIPAHAYLSAVLTQRIAAHPHLFKALESVGARAKDSYLLLHNQIQKILDARPILNSPELSRQAQKMLFLYLAVLAAIPPSADIFSSHVHEQEAFKAQWRALTDPNSPEAQKLSEMRTKIAIDNLLRALQNDIKNLEEQKNRNSNIDPSNQTFEENYPLFSNYCRHNLQDHTIEQAFQAKTKLDETYKKSGESGMDQQQILYWNVLKSLEKPLKYCQKIREQ